MRARLSAHAEASSFGTTLASIRLLFDHVPLVDAAHPQDRWIARDALLDARSGPLAALLDRIGERYASGRRHAGAASFMLRFSWSAGPMIAAHLALGGSLRYHDYALRFSPSTALEAICIPGGEFSAASVDPAAARRHLLDALMGHTEPVLDALHRRSSVSRRALWGMVTSIWAAQFVAIAERLGDAELGRREAQALFELLPKLIRSTAPWLYSVACGDRRGVCQVRSACCFNHQRTGGQHCMVCPMISAAERAERNRDWLANRVPTEALDPAVAAALRSSHPSVGPGAISSRATRR